MELEEEIDGLLKSLRKCDTQATAVKWMTQAYKAMEKCLDALKERPEQIARERILFLPERPNIEVVSSIGLYDKKLAEHKRRELQNKSASQTVVYPDVFLPKGLKPLPKPWTREDTLRLERASKMGPKRIQRLGK